MTIEYEALTPDDFDAIVTGELNHWAIWFEGRLNEFFVSHLGVLGRRKDTFKRYFLYREGLKFQDKIEIAIAILKHHALDLNRQKINTDRIIRLLKEVEAFKSIRNALAHGLDVRQSEVAEGPRLKVEVVTRSGQEKTIVITPDSHRERLEQLDRIFNELNQLLKSVEAYLSTEVHDEMKEELMGLL